MTPISVHTPLVPPRAQPQEESTLLSRILNVALASFASLLAFLFLPAQIAGGAVSAVALAGLLYVIWPCCKSEESGLSSAPTPTHSPASQLHHVQVPTPRPAFVPPVYAQQPQPSVCTMPTPRPMPMTMPQHQRGPLPMPVSRPTGPLVPRAMSASSPQPMTMPQPSMGPVPMPMNRPVTGPLVPRAMSAPSPQPMAMPQPSMGPVPMPMNRPVAGPLASRAMSVPRPIPVSMG